MINPDAQKAMDDLRVVREMIERTRRVTMESGVLFIWWGILSIVAICLNYYFQTRGWFKAIGIIWALFLVAGYAGTYVHLRKRKRNGVISFIDRLIGATWSACGITVIIFAFIAPPAGAFDWGYVPSMVTAVLALGVFITGALYEWRSLIYTALLWWAGAIAMFLFEERGLLIMGILVGGLMVVLGFIAKARQKRERIVTPGSA